MIACKIQMSRDETPERSMQSPWRIVKWFLHILLREVKITGPVLSFTLYSWGGIYSPHSVTIHLSGHFYIPRKSDFSWCNMKIPEKHNWQCVSTEHLGFVGCPQRKPDLMEVCTQYGSYVEVGTSAGVEWMLLSFTKIMTSLPEFQEIQLDAYVG